MGWASASEIFDPVAKALIDLNASAGMKRRLLGTLIGKLQDGDWDTEDESLREFRHDPAIVQAFYAHDVGNTIEGDQADGTIGYDAHTDRWTLDCSRHGVIGSAPGTAEGHDNLVHQWAHHDERDHEGDGEVPTWILLAGAESEADA
jgi:hypothetical protein